MYTFRFNPLFGQWVMLGGPVIQPQRLPAASLLDIGRHDGFQAATYPRQPFLLEPAAQFGHKDRLYLDQPPVGDYELLLYKEEPDFFAWKEAQWTGWLSLVQQRVLQLHHNPHLHYLSLSLHTAALESIEGYQRVGDLVATSHPVCGAPPPLSPELAEKIRGRESAYQVIGGPAGSLYVPSAPLRSGEAWYLPTTEPKGVEELDKEDRQGCARVLARLFAALRDEFPHKHYVLHLHSGFAERTGSSWWIQVYQQTPDSDILPVRPLPEGFLRTLRLLLA